MRHGTLLLRTESRQERTRARLREPGSGAEERDLDSQPKRGEIGVSAGWASRARIWGTSRLRCSTRCDGRPRPYQHRRWSEARRADLARRHLGDAQGLTANAMAGARAILGVVARRGAVETRIERMLHAWRVHAVTAGQMLGSRHPLRAGLGTMRSSKGQRGGEQGQQIEEVGPGPCHLTAMLPKPIAARHHRVHEAQLLSLHGLFQPTRAAARRSGFRLPEEEIFAGRRSNEDQRAIGNDTACRSRMLTPSLGTGRPTETIDHRVHLGGEDARIEVWELSGVGQSSELMHEEGRLGWCRAIPDRIGWVDEPGIPGVHPVRPRTFRPRQRCCGPRYRGSTGIRQVISVDRCRMCSITGTATALLEILVLQGSGCSSSPSEMRGKVCGM